MPKKYNSSENYRKNQRDIRLRKLAYNLGGQEANPKIQGLIEKAYLQHKKVKIEINPRLKRGVRYIPSEKYLAAVDKIWQKVDRQGDLGKYTGMKKIISGNKTKWIKKELQLFRDLKMGKILKQSQNPTDSKLILEGLKKGKFSTYKQALGFMSIVGLDEYWDKWKDYYKKVDNGDGTSSIIDNDTGEIVKVFDNNSGDRIDNLDTSPIPQKNTKPDIPTVGEISQEEDLAAGYTPVKTPMKKSLKAKIPLTRMVKFRRVIGKIFRKIKMAITHAYIHIFY